MIIVIGNGHGDVNSHVKGTNLFSLQLWVNSRADCAL